MSFRGNSRGGRGGRGGRGRNPGPRFGGPKLPALLQDEVDAAYGTAGKSKYNGPRARKEARKADRKGPPPREQARRPRENDEHQAAPEAKARGKRPASPDVEEQEQPRKKSKSKKEEKDVKENKTRTKKDGKDTKDTSKDAKKDAKKKKELTLPEDDGDAEDREIAWLEYMLKKEKKGDDDLSDGLDDILGFADKLGPGGSGLQRGEVSDDSDAGDEWMGIESGDDFLVDSDEDEDGSGEEESGEENDEEDGDEDEDEGSEGDDEDEGEEEVEDDAGAQDGTQPASTSDAPATVESAPAGRYIPPHLRAAMLGEKAAGDSVKAAERVKLERKAQGLLNKLSEANIESILADVEKLFGEYSRNDVTTTLTSLVIQMIGSKTNLLDSFVVLYATLVGALHRVVGLEFGAHFVQTLVKKYHELAQNTAPSAAAAANDENDAHREAFNLLTLIAELYNAGVVGAGLVYDLIRGFIGDDDATVMSERSVEGLLKILKCCGSQLRTDDPASLKDIVGLVQERTRGKEKEMTTRARFMVETLVALRSGKTKGLGAEREDVARMRRFLSGLGKKRRLLAPEPLRVGLSDLLSADARGKWWLVGAGWSGNPLVERAEALASKDKGKKKAKKEQEDEEVLLELARKQGMNTDVRRSVFVVLLTSEDYVHAYERLTTARLTDVQQREFVRVALHCCGMEQTYNPYYTLVLNHLCTNSYDHRFTLQYALWDMFRDLADASSTVPEHRATNVARALAFLIARASVDVTILKALDFTDLSKPTRRFVDTLLRSLLVATQTASPLLTLPRGFDPRETDTEAVEETFERALVNPELAGGLAWVLQSIRKTADKGVGEKEAEVVRQGAQAALSVLARAI